MKRIDFLLRAAALSALAIVIWLSLAPRPLPGQPIPPDLTWIAHGVMYFLLGLICAAALRRALPAVVAMLLVLGVGLELAQALVPHRVVGWPDLAANLGGAALGLAAFLAARQIWRRRHPATGKSAA